MTTGMAGGTRFPAGVDAALRAAGWRPGRWDIKQAEEWADRLRAYVSPGGHRHAVFPAAVEAWAEFGGLAIPGAAGPGRQIAPSGVVVDPMSGLYLARTFGDLGRALETEISPLGEEPGSGALLAIDTEGRVYTIDHTGDWYAGPDIDRSLTDLVGGVQPVRLTLHPDAGTSPR
ncbi:SUKH-3 domain-containing protein [Streptomyces sp.]|uniref:SUKH-3 domain-containing protein n=1 Tax=Streptomyces sp. TaxID=1931 RepID=UPI002F40393A